LNEQNDHSLREAAHRGARGFDYRGKALFQLPVDKPQGKAFCVVNPHDTHGER
jgi:hypothetical protein